MDVAIPSDFDFEGFRDRIDTFSADAMETARNLVSAFTEFTAGMEVCHDEFEGRDLVFWVDVDGDTAAIIFDGTGAIEVKGDGNVFAMTSEGFINGIIDNFENAVMETSFEGITDVHIGAFAHPFKTLKFLNFRRIVSIVRDLTHFFL
jgi:hypothetical protein